MQAVDLKHYVAQEMTDPTNAHLTESVRLPNSIRRLSTLAVLLVVIGITAGSACAGFLASLDLVTELHWRHPWLLYCLPLVGMLIALVYQHYGKQTEAGTSLILDEIQEPRTGVPARIVPLVLLGTLATHLCGGSAGREGTAIQMGGGIASSLVNRIRSLTQSDSATLLRAGMAAGFGGVFGTPFAGTVFALEVTGKPRTQAILPCLLAAWISHWTCTTWGIGHTTYRIAEVTPRTGISALLDPALLLKSVIAGVAFGLAARLFCALAHTAKVRIQQLITTPVLRPALGGLCVVLLAKVLGTTEYLGLGVTNPNPELSSIVAAFQAGGAEPVSWLWKIIFTVLTVSSGFKGGEVTPLFFVGATLGNALAGPLQAPVDLCAGLGLVAVFGAAANTPLACTIMAVELFGGWNVLYFTAACFVAYYVSGRSGLYDSQHSQRS